MIKRNMLWLVPVYRGVMSVLIPLSCDVKTRGLVLFCRFEGNDISSFMPVLLTCRYCTVHCSTPSDECSSFSSATRRMTDFLKLTLTGSS